MDYKFLLGNKTKLSKDMYIFCTITYYQVPVSISVDFSFETKPEIHTEVYIRLTAKRLEILEKITLISLFFD